MSQRKPNSEASDFGRLVRTLRGYESRSAFARRLGVGEGTIANVESGQRSRSKKVLDALIVALPDDELAIRSAYYGSFNTVTTPESQSAPDTLSTSAVTTGQELKHFLLLQLESPAGPKLVFEFRAALACTRLRLNESVELARSDLDLAIAALRQVPGISNETEETLRDKAVIAFIDGLMDRQAYQAVNSFTDELLVSDIADHQLWMAKGRALWLLHSYADAYAALTSALAYGRPRTDRAIYLRGCLLADWGCYDEALIDLEIVIGELTTYRYSQVTILLAKSWRAYVLAMQGDVDAAEKAFVTVEDRLAGNAWFRYLRGSVALDVGDTKAAIDHFSAAVSTDSYMALNPLKQDALTEQLRQLRRKRVGKMKKVGDNKSK